MRPRSIPQDDVVGVEGPVPQRRSDDGLLLHHAPAQSVRRDQPVEQGDIPAGRQGRPLVGDGLVALLGICLGVLVLDDGNGPALASRHRPHQVVLLRPLMLYETQIRLHPVDPVQTLGVGGVDGFLHCPGPVPHPVAVPVLDDHRVEDRLILPGTIPVGGRSHAARDDGGRGGRWPGFRSANRPRAAGVGCPAGAPLGGPRIRSLRANRQRRQPRKFEVRAFELSVLGTSKLALRMFSFAKPNPPVESQGLADQPGTFQ